MKSGFQNYAPLQKETGNECNIFDNVECSRLNQTGNLEKQTVLKIITAVMSKESNVIIIALLGIINI